MVFFESISISAPNKSSLGVSENVRRIECEKLNMGCIYLDGMLKSVVANKFV